MEVVTVKNLSKQFKRVVKSGNLFKDLFKQEFVKVNAVSDVSFSIDKGESVAFLGPNGAGKTTTIKMLTGLIFPTSGEVSVLGYFPFDRKRDFLMRIGLVMGNKAGLNWDLTPNQSFELLKEIYKIPADTFKSRLKELTELLDTERFLNTQVRRLSLGERMKMELIGAILHQPEILFLDEPTIGLDITSKKKIREFLREIQKKHNVTMLLTSHDMDDIERVCDRVIVINKGTKVYDDSLERLTIKYNQEKFVKFYFEKLPDEDEFKGFEISNKNDNSYTFKVKRSDLPKITEMITSKYDVLDIDILSTPLEEIIEDIFKK